MATRVTNYFTANGRIRAERTAGFPGHDYIPDGLGNVSATASPTTQDLQYFARYLPYGRGYNVQTTNTLPAFRWVGTLGYRATGRRHDDQDVRRRHLSWSDGRWTSADPLWPSQPAFGYVRGDPVASGDPSGLQCYLGKGCTPVTFDLSIAAQVCTIKRRTINSFDFLAYVDVPMDCTINCSPGGADCAECPCPNCDFPQWDTGYTLAAGVRTTYRDHFDGYQKCNIKQTQLCGPLAAKYYMWGRDAPGWLARNGSRCAPASTWATPIVVSLSDFPFDYDMKWTTCCGCNPPPTCQLMHSWKIKITAEVADIKSGRCYVKGTRTS